MNFIDTKKIKVFYPSTGKIITKVAYVLKRNRVVELCVLKEDVTLYGDTVTQAHTALLNDIVDVYHFVGGLANALNKFESIPHDKYLAYQIDLAMTKGKAI